MILAKIANELPLFSVFYHSLKFWTWNFYAPYLLQKTFASHGFPLNNVHLRVYYHPSKFAGHLVYIIKISIPLVSNILEVFFFLFKTKFYYGFQNIVVCNMFVLENIISRVDYLQLLIIHYLPISNWTLPTLHLLLNIYKNTGRIILKL